jgi:hypothetical protein
MGQDEVEKLREGLVNERYERLASALDVINVKLSAVYRFLTGVAVRLLYNCTSTLCISTS